MNTLCIIIAIVELIVNIKLFFFKVLVFYQISRVYVACANLRYCGTNNQSFTFCGTSGITIPPQSYKLSTNVYLWQYKILLLLIFALITFPIDV